MDNVRRQPEDGFSLIELLVVVLIIAILVAVAVPVYLGQRRKGFDAAAKSDVRHLVSAQADHYEEDGAYAASVDVLEISGLNRTTGVVLATCPAGEGFFAAGYHPSGSRSFTFDSTTGVVRVVAEPVLPTSCTWDATGPVLAEPPSAGSGPGGESGSDTGGATSPTTGDAGATTGDDSGPATGEPTSGDTTTTGGTTMGDATTGDTTTTGGTTTGDASTTGSTTTTTGGTTGDTTTGGTTGTTTEPTTGGGKGKKK